MKECSRCKEVKPLSEFHAMRNTADGYRPDCKDCHLRYYYENPQYLEKSKQWHKDNPKKHRKATCKWRNKPEAKEYERKYRLENKDHINEVKRKNYKQNRENILTKSKEQYKANPEIYRARALAYYYRKKAQNV